MGSRTRANPMPFVALNILFLHDVNLKYQVKRIKELPRQDFLTDMCIEDLSPNIVKLVRKGFKFSVDHTTLDFYKLNTPLTLDNAEEWAQRHLNQDLRTAAVKLQHAQLLNIALNPDDIGGNYVDLVVLGEALQEPEERDTVGELPSGFGPYKRYSTLKKNIKKLTPSSAAKSTERESFQKSLSTVIHDGTFALDRTGKIAVETIAQPIEIFYPPFRRILDVLEDLTFQPDPKLLDAISTVVSRAGFIGQEDDYEEKLRKPFMEVLKAYIGRVYTSGKHSADGLVYELMIDALIPLLFLELKRAFGEGGCDPIVQAEYSVLKRWDEDELESLREKCPCPTLILAGGGSNFALLGAVWADRFIVQRLSDIVFLAQASTSVDDHIYKVARFFSAIKLGIDDLRNYYLDISSRNVQPLQPDIPHPRFFPSPTRFRCRQRKEVISFHYLNAMDDDDSRNLAYLAQTEEPQPRELIIKFSDRYGYEAHQLLADAKRAPELFYCGLLDGESDVLDSEKARGRIRKDAGGLYTGPLRMIVMEYLAGEDASKTLREEWPGTARDEIKAAIGLLHQAGFVFGDLRRPNVIFVDGATKLIDFDWSGKEGDVFYPYGLSKTVGWVEGVKSFRQIEKKHDLEMLEKHFPAS